MSNRFYAGYTLLAVLLIFLVAALLAYRTMEHWQQENDLAHGFSEADALLALPQFRLVDTSGSLLPQLLNQDARSGNETRYVVLAGSFFRKERARDHMTYLRQLGLHQSQLLHFRGERDIYAVGVGRHADLTKAQEQMKMLQNEFNVDVYVHKIRRDP
ncbi:MAG: hypothetical protein J5I41_01005 [Saprospiraceae bacterium]|nr:hypothetical protein [Saprospiraceae bacterium]